MGGTEFKARSMGVMLCRYRPLYMALISTCVSLHLFICVTLDLSIMQGTLKVVEVNNKFLKSGQPSQQHIAWGEKTLNTHLLISI